MGNILNFSVGANLDLEVPPSFWTRLASKYGKEVSMWVTDTPRRGVVRMYALDPAPVRMIESPGGGPTLHAVNIKALPSGFIIEIFCA